ncbi:MAG: hypothetical protein ACLVKA_04015 [Collinsella aerofaciens]
MISLSKVRATSTPRVSDGIRANGNITIDDSGAVTARATEDKGIGTDKNLTIIKGTVEASPEKDAAVMSRAACSHKRLNVNGVEYGVYAHKGITLDHANVTVRAGKGR